MKRIWLAVGIILLFVGVTIAPTINFNIVKASQQNIIKERINQRKLLFQTILDIANNKEIQRIILKSQMSRGIFLASELPVVTKTQLKMMYFLGLILSKVVSKSRMQFMVQKYQLMIPKIQQELSTVINNDVILKKEITQLQNSECDCENENTTVWHFPIICSILLQFLYLSSLLWDIGFGGHPLIFYMGMLVGEIVFLFAFTFNCSWLYP